MTQKKQLETENCLKGIECPNCGNNDDFNISVEAMHHVTNEGLAGIGNFQWFEDSPCICTRCKYHGTVSDFSADKIRPNTIHLTDAELNQVLAALRHWANCLPEIADDERYSEYTEDGIEFMGESEINALCERFVLGPIGE